MVVLSSTELFPLSPSLPISVGTKLSENSAPPLSPTLREAPSLPLYTSQSPPYNKQVCMGLGYNDVKKIHSSAFFLPLPCRFCCYTLHPVVVQLSQTLHDHLPKRLWRLICRTDYLRKTQLHFRYDWMTQKHIVTRTPFLQKTGCFQNVDLCK